MWGAGGISKLGELLLALEDNTVYEQKCEDFRSLQEIFWKVPFFAMTITGALGFVVLSTGGDVGLKRLLLFFVTICNIAFIFIAWRLRSGVMEPMLKQISDLENRSRPAPSYTVLWFFTALFGLVAVVALWLALFGANELFVPSAAIDKTAQG